MRFTFNVRTITRGVAWVMLTVIFINVLLNFFRAPPPPVTSNSASSIDTSIANISVAFAKEWMTLDKGELPESYKNRISPYVSPILVENFAGITNISETKPQKVVNAWLISYDTIDNSHCIANVGVHYLVDNMDQYIRLNIPIAITKDKSLVIYGNPSFSPIVMPQDVDVPNFGNSGQVADTNQMRVTLDSFFQKYLSGQEQAELSNFLTESGKKVIYPKKGIVTYDNILDIKTFPKGPSKDNPNIKYYTAIVTVSVKNPASSMTVNSQYVIFLQEQGSKYLIHQILP